MEKVYRFQLNLNWDLIQKLNTIDRFDTSWSAVEKAEESELRHLKTMATVRSVGASTRIEGSKMTDEQVDVLLKKLDISQLEDRDSQEVMGYFKVMDLITSDFNAIDLSEGSIKSLHSILMQFSQKDQWHKGDYKQQANSVEASLPDGTKQIIFNTTPPGLETQMAMRDLVEWYQSSDQAHALVKIALLTYEFLSIHPFQDGNGRLSRLLSTLLLLQQGYSWVQYVSFEHEIEAHKSDYYRVLRQCQGQRPNEDVTPWVLFFLTRLEAIESALLKKVESLSKVTTLSKKEKAVIALIAARPEIRSGEVAKELDLALPTVKRMLSHLVKKGFVQRVGAGRATGYKVK